MCLAQTQNWAAGVYQKGFNTHLPIANQKSADPAPAPIQAPAPAAPAAPAPVDPNPSSTAAIQAVADQKKANQLAIQNSQSSASNAGLNTGYLVN